MMDIVIVAGGLGTRLAGKEGRIPKTLLPVGDRTILDIIIGTMNEVFDGGFHLIIAAGVFFEDLRSYIQSRWKDRNVEVVRASKWKEGNAATVLAAEELIGGPQFIVQMSDHLFAPETYQRCTGKINVDIPAVCAQPASDGIPAYLDLDDATKILADKDNRIRAIGKDLTDWNAIDMGIFRFPTDIFETIRSLPYGKKSLSECVRARIASTGFFVSLQPGAIWKDIDSEADLQWATRMAEDGLWGTENS